MDASKYIVRDRAPAYITGLAYYPYDKKFAERFSGKDRFDDPFDLSRREGKYLGLPIGLAALQPDHDYRVDGDPVTLKLNKKNKPRNDEQVRVLGESLRYLNEGVSHIIEGTTGFGKTYIGLTLAGKLGLKTLVVVNKEDLLAKWRDDALKFLDVSTDDIGYIQGDRCDVDGKKIVIAMVQTLWKQKKEHADIYKAFGLVIFDEVHHMAADKFSVAAGLLWARLRLGLTATPVRPDGRQFIFEAHIGKVLVTTHFIPMEPKILIARSDWKCPRIPQKVHGEFKMVRFPHEHGKLGGILKSLAQWPSRNLLIAKLAKMIYKEKRTAIILSDLARENHLDGLRAEIVKLGVPDKDIGFYVGGMSETAIENTKTKRIVLATYAMAGEATDVPWWDTSIFATPRANVRQPLGRILREYPDKRRPIGIDILDTDSPVLMDYYEARLRQYAGLNARVVPLAKV